MNSSVVETEVCVVGAGVMGAFAAWNLAERGLGVILVDRSAPGSEASCANTGTIAVQNKKTEIIPLVLRAIRLWDEMSDRLGVDVEYEKRGGFRVAHTAEDVGKLERAVIAQRAVGARVEMVHQPELAAEAPYLSPAIEAASYCPDDGMANSLAVVRGVLRACCHAGVQLRPHCPVERIEVPGDHAFVVWTPQGRIRCSTVLAAAGAWNADVAGMVGVSLPVFTEILQALITDFGPPVFPHVVTHVQGNLTLKQQRVTGKIIVGGAWKGEGSRENGVKRLTRESIIGNLRWAAATIPAIVGAQLLRGWAGFEGRTPDKLLLVGPVGAPAGFHVLGCSGGGFTLSPIAGVLAADLIARGTSEIPCEAFRAQRFSHAAAGPNDATPRVSLNASNAPVSSN